MQMLKSTLQNPNFVLLFLLFWCGGASYAMRGRMHISNIWELDTFSALEGFEATHYMLLLCKQNINTIQSIIWSARPMIGNCLIIFLEGRGETESPATTQTVCWRICHSNFVEFGTDVKIICIQISNIGSRIFRTWRLRNWVWRDYTLYNIFF